MQAYDRVSREALFRRLRKLGFGGCVYDFLQDIYTNDILYLQVNGELTAGMYLTQGLKQGCNLSPLFFNIMMTPMCKALVESGEGGRLGDKRIPGLFFADDIGYEFTTTIYFSK